MPRRALTSSSESDDSDDKIVTSRCYRATTSRSSSNPWILQDVTGNNPPIGSLLEAADVEAGKVYMYGTRTSRHSKNCDLFMFDHETLKVVNLSTYMQPLDREDNLEETGSRRKKSEKFPMIDFPAFAFMSSTECLVIFGGCLYYKEDQSDGLDSSDLFLINISDCFQPQWWRQQVEGVAKPRMDATITVIGDRIYLFGGVDKAHSPGEEPGTLLRTYSIIEHDRENQQWRWVVSDVPYPREIPSDISFGRATPVYEGERILLTPARTAPDYYANFTSQNIFYFCTETHRFIKAKVMTEDTNLPQRLSSYYTSPYIPPPNKYTLGDNSKYPFASPQKRRLLFQTVSSTESVLICGWRTLTKDKKPTPELWRLFLFPWDRVLCLNIEATEDLTRFPAEFHYFTVMNQRICLLGSEEEEGFNQDDLDATEMLLDVCLEIPLKPSDEDMDID